MATIKADYRIIDLRDTAAPDRGLGILGANTTDVEGQSAARKATPRIAAKTYAKTGLDMRASWRPRPVAYGGTPQPGDVVSLRCPERDAPNLPGVKTRPCLVLDVKTQRGINGEKMTSMVVAWGTTDTKSPPRPGEVVFNDLETIGRLGLGRPVKFDLARRHHVFWDARFVSAVDRKPILGALEKRDLARVAAALGEARHLEEAAQAAAARERSRAEAWAR